MKKVLISMLISIMSAALLTGCASDTETVIGDSVLSETTEEISEETPVAPEEVATSEETSIEEVEEAVIYSADEVMAHIDSLITQYQYNDPEHIKALVIAANLDYISEDDLNTILSTYGYTMEELAVKYDECILDNAAASKETLEYYQGNIDSLPKELKYSNRIEMQAVMMNESDMEVAQRYDIFLQGDASGEMIYDERRRYLDEIENCEDNLTSAKRMVYSYSQGVYYRLSYPELLDNPFAAYSK